MEKGPRDDAVTGGPAPPKGAGARVLTVCTGLANNARGAATYVAANLPHLDKARQRKILRSALVISGVADVDRVMADAAQRRKAIGDLQALVDLPRTGRLDAMTSDWIETLDREEHGHYDEAEVLAWEAAAIIRARDPAGTPGPDAARRKEMIDAAKARFRERHAPVKASGPVAPAESPADVSKRIAAARADAHRHDFLGLAYSGGGIRSAAFNLGVTQALAERGLLAHFDYLSTVSGGGYIGSWLSSGIRHSRGLEEFQKRFMENEANALLEGKRHPVQHLRDHSNYLTPRTGLLSADVWTFGATYARNLLLNLVILIACFVTVLVSIRLLGSFGTYLSHALQADPDLFPAVRWGLGLIATVALTGALAFISATFERELRPWSYGKWRWASKKAATVFVVLLVIAAYAGSLWLWIFKSRLYHAENYWWLVPLWVVSCLGGFLVGALLHPRPKDYVPPPGTAIPGGLLRFVFFMASGFSLLTAMLLLGALIREYSEKWLDSWEVATWGVPVTILVFCVSLIFLTGMGGRYFPERVRESWGRLGADVLLAVLAWTAAFAIAIYGPILLEAAGVWIGGLGAATLIGYTVTALLLARSTLTGARSPKDSRVELAVEIAPWLFMIGVALYLSWGLHQFLGTCWFPEWKQVEAIDTRYGVWCADPARTAPDVAFDRKSDDSLFGGLDLVLSAYYKALDYSLYNSIGLLLVAGFIVFSYVLSRGVDVNLFSMHPLYRNRLVRCFLGATSPVRRPHPHTLLDEADDQPFAASLPHGAVHRPYHLVNCAINLTTGQRLAWQERKASSFFISPRFSGYNLGDKPTQPRGGGCYRLTEDFARFDEDDPGLTLGTAMTISGAAASPNMGYHSSFRLAFLMTVFNMRLGVWAPNTKSTREWQARSGPALGLMYLILEIFGSVNAYNDYVYLSDGGHFENLGIYELVRRRCRVIVCSDASRDEEFSFEDLGNAVRKCQIDFGVRIEFPKGLPSPGATPRLLEEAWAIGVIHYADVDGDGAKPGYLVYLKSSLVGKEGADIFSYSREHAGFPHDTTTNQWFSESRFESYRSLGKHIVEVFLRDGLEVTAQSGTVSRVELVEKVAAAAAGRHAPPAIY